MRHLAIIPAWMWLVFSALFFALGEYLSKKFAFSPSWLLTACIVASYAGGTLLWLPAIYDKKTLAITGVVWLLFGMVATVGIGTLLFKEELTLLQWLGIALAAGAVALLGI